MDAAVHDTPPSAARIGRSVLFSAMKNEAPFLLEWVAYHRAIGFDHVIVFHNDSDDGTKELLAALDAAGVVEAREHSPAPGVPAQGNAARLANEAGVLAGSDWAMWLDADEFLNIHAGSGQVSDLVAALGPHLGIQIPWRLFGDCGAEDFGGRFLSDAFTGAATATPDHPPEGKAFFRMGQHIRGLGVNSIHRPVLNASSGTSADDFIGGNGRTLNPTTKANLKWFRGLDNGLTCLTDPSEFGWDLAQINHYLVRTPSLYLLKKARGDGWRVGMADRRLSAKFYRRNNRNEVEDRTILRHEAAVLIAMERLRALPGVAAAEALSKQRLADRLATLAPDVQAFTAKVRPIPAGQVAVPARATAATTQTPVPAAPAPEDPALQSFVLTFPPAEAAHLRETYGQARMILEYGSGGSTVLAAGIGKPVISVESDKAWAERLTAQLATLSDRARVLHVDIGPTGKWGMPVRPRFHDRFHRYALSVWDRPDLGEPDLVLIDGRFRAACLAAVRLRARTPTAVLFDDYADRPYYHRVEALARKDGMIGRMARFTVTPGPIPPEMLTEVVGWFSDPR